MLCRRGRASATRSSAILDEIAASKFHPVSSTALTKLPWFCILEDIHEGLQVPNLYQQ
jgi:hypothetical protein